MKDSYNCDALAIAGATAAIDDQAWLARTRATILATRNGSPSRNRIGGFSVYSFAGQFRLVPAPHRTGQRALQRLKADGVLVRYLHYPRWEPGLRSASARIASRRLVDPTRALWTVAARTIQGSVVAMSTYRRCLPHSRSKIGRPGSIPILQSIGVFSSLAPTAYNASIKSYSIFSEDFIDNSRNFPRVGT